MPNTPMKQMVRRVANRVFNRNVLATEEYFGEHEAPDKSSGAPMHNLTGTYPEDLYSGYGVQMYGDGDAGAGEAWGIISSVRNHPNRSVKIYRAVPKILSPEDQLFELLEMKRQFFRRNKIPAKMPPNVLRSSFFDTLDAEIKRLQSLPPVQTVRPKIQHGNWVTIVRGYAVEHGQSNLNNSYRILSKTVPARTLYTDGNSLQEWGYDP